ncbi:hypothetical protein [Streptomyces albipurpureus]|uniref:Lipoprotein n=1 Tax=Streptomyces albipurpureus TaxID=2897419 RepID=A0ABT0UXP7_9ACTN|nr:hypothetical protein [Streptomyces sp. CWNU-1]MCM2393342.1 hypothetical protein [Streptomyces sp. CWNU-1]
MSARRWFGGRLVVVGMASAVALTLTGCGDGDGKDSEKDEVASVQGDKAGAQNDKGATSELATYVEGQRKWVQCLRDKGLDAPDPDAKGSVKLGDASKLKKDPKFLAAMEKCSDLSLAVPAGVEKAQQGKLSKKEIETRKKYSKCMQDKGAPDFPDTNDDGHTEEVTWDQSSAGAKRAARECGSIIGVPADGTYTPQG